MESGSVVKNHRGDSLSPLRAIEAFNFCHNIQKNETESNAGGTGYRSSGQAGSIIRGAAENPLAYCFDTVLCEFIVTLRHYLALRSIRRDKFDAEKAGIGASRFHTEKGGDIFFISGTPNVDQLCKRVSCNKTEISFPSASVARWSIAAFIENFLLYRR
jgi:hypothetical protein